MTGVVRRRTGRHLHNSIAVGEGKDDLSPLWAVQAELRQNINLLLLGFHVNLMWHCHGNTRAHDIGLRLLT